MTRAIPCFAVCAAAACAFLTALHAQQPSAAASASAATPAAPVVDIRTIIHTEKGDIEALLYASKAPMTVANFLNLAQQKFYDGLKFHRVIPEFMIQGGDPTGTGAGNPGYQFEDEKNGDRKFDKPGVMAMANHGSNTNGSQFFITHVAVPHLNDDGGYGHYTIFGQVTKGQDVVNAITQGDRIKSIDILDSTTPLFTKEATDIEKWNAQMTKKH